MTIKKHKDLYNLLGDPANITLINGGTSLHSPVYHLLPVDLRQDPSESLAPVLSQDTNGSLLDLALPTLLLFECVLCYLAPEKSSRLLHWFKGYIQPSAAFGCIIYEMFGLDSQFGRVMKGNLRVRLLSVIVRDVPDNCGVKARNVELPGAEPFQTIEQVQQRLVDLGLTVSSALSLDAIRKECIPKSELQR